MKIRFFNCGAFAQSTNPNNVSIFLPIKPAGSSATGIKAFSMFCVQGAGDEVGIWTKQGVLLYFKEFNN
jgi:hypothetical protein